MESKEILCLANSRKHQGRCIAGKEIKSKNWIRPVSKRQNGELKPKNMKYEESGIPTILDKMKIYLKRPKEKKHQPENFLVAEKEWEKLGKLDMNDIEKYEDDVSVLWTNCQPKKDRISFDFLKRHHEHLPRSLLLIKPEKSKILVQNYEGNKRIKSRFKYKNVLYNLTVTDPVVEDFYRNADKGEYEIHGLDPYYCISLGEPFEGCCYKLIAGIISRKFQKKREIYQKKWYERWDSNYVGGEDKQSSQTEKSSEIDFEELTKQYKEVSEKIENTKKEMKEETKELSMKITELKEELEEIERPYRDRLDQYESQLERIEEKILDKHSGKKEKKNTNFAEVHFRVSKSVEIKDKNKIVNILKNKGVFEQGVKIGKNTVRKLIKKDLVEKDIASFKETKHVKIKPNIDLTEGEKKLYRKLKSYRQEIANDEGISYYKVLSDRILKLIAKERPIDEKKLKDIRGIGEIRLKKYGDDILELVRKDLKESDSGKRVKKESENKIGKNDNSNQVGSKAWRKKIKNKHPKAYESWSQEEEKKLINLRKDDVSVTNISKKLKRTPGAITSRISKLKEEDKL